MIQSSDNHELSAHQYLRMSAAQTLIQYSHNNDVTIISIHIWYSSKSICNAFHWQPCLVDPCVFPASQDDKIHDINMAILQHISAACKFHVIHCKTEQKANRRRRWTLWRRWRWRWRRRRQAGRQGGREEAIRGLRKSGSERLRLSTTNIVSSWHWYWQGIASIMQGVWLLRQWSRRDPMQAW